MKSIVIRIILGSVLILTLISCEEEPDWDWIFSDNSGVILNSITYSTIQEAINEAVNGDTIFLTEGIFADAYDKNLSWDGEEKHLTIALHENADYSIIECNKDGSGFIFEKTHQNTSDVIDAITIRNCGDIYDSGIYCEETSPTIRNCTISDCDWSGIYCKDSAPIIENNEIFGNKVGIMCDENSAPSIQWNILENNSVESIYSIADSRPSISNNLIVNNKRGIHCLENAYAYLVNNTIADNEEWGIKLRGTSDTTKIINTIIWDNGTCFDIGSSKISVSYSCSPDSIPSVNPESLGNIYDDPLFVSPEEGYHLVSISPCIDAGDSTAVSWDFDLDGNGRISSDNVDIGAYEFGMKK